MLKNYLCLFIVVLWLFGLEFCCSNYIINLGDHAGYLFDESYYPCSDVVASLFALIILWKFKFSDEFLKFCLELRENLKRIFFKLFQRFVSSTPRILLIWIFVRIIIFICWWIIASWWISKDLMITLIASFYRWYDRLISYLCDCRIILASDIHKNLNFWRGF